MSVVSVLCALFGDDDLVLFLQQCLPLAANNISKYKPHRLLGLQQDNTLLRNAMENEASKFRCSECAKQDTGQSSQKQDSPLLMTLNKSLQTQLQQAQQQLLQQQKKAKDQVDEQKTEVLSWKNKAHAAQRKVDELLAQVRYKAHLLI